MHLERRARVWFSGLGEFVLPSSVLLIIVALVQISQAIPSHPDIDSEVAGFFVSALTPKGKQSVSTVVANGAKVTCTFEYAIASGEPEPSPSPSDRLVNPNDLFRAFQNTPCLSIVSGYHSYQICLGREITQLIGKNADDKVTIGTSPRWNSEGFFEQHYVDGTECTSGGAKRKATVFFLCREGEVAVKAVHEPQACSYEIEIWSSEVCKYPKQIRRNAVEATSGPAEPVETWFMEVSESVGSGVVCTAHAAGFGRPTPTHSEFIERFSIRMTANETPMTVSHFDVRYGSRRSYPAEKFVISEKTWTLQPINPLPHSPNFVTISAPSPK